MGNHRPIKVDLGLATIIAAVIAAIAAITVAIINIINNNGSTSSSPSDGVISTVSSESSEANNSSSVAISSTSSSSSDLGEPSSSSISSDVTNSSEPIISSSISEPIEFSEPQNITHSVSDENGKIELFSDHSGVAYIYKRFLDENPIGKVNGIGDTIIGWSISLHCNEKVLSFNILSQSDKFECTAQYNLDGEYQGTYLYDMFTKREENGDIIIEFDINKIAFDLRDSTKIEIMYIIDPV